MSVITYALSGVSVWRLYDLTHSLLSRLGLAQIQKLGNTPLGLVTLPSPSWVSHNS